MTALRHHLLYWIHRFRNEFRRLTLRRPREEDVVGETMHGLKRNPQLRALLEKAEAKRDQLGKGEGR